MKTTIIVGISYDKLNRCCQCEFMGLEGDDVKCFAFDKILEEKYTKTNEPYVRCIECIDFIEKILKFRRGA